MEDRNSWNELIFYHINARREWLSSLIWRNQQKIEGDTTEDKNNDDTEKKKKIDLDPSDKGMIDWFEERQRNFRQSSEEVKDSSKEGIKTPHCWNEEKNYPSETISSRDRNWVDETTVCEGAKVSKTPQSWNEEENYPAETISSRDRNWVDKTTVCEGAKVSKTPQSSRYLYQLV